MDEPGKINGEWASEALLSEQDATLGSRVSDPDTVARSEALEVKPVAADEESWDGKIVPVESLLDVEDFAVIALDAEPAMLSFESGATRNRKENELAYSGFISPLALQMFARYMHKHRHTADGSVRDPDNWQRGIPDESYIDSLLRHVMDLWLIYRGFPEAAREGKFSALAGAFFNVQGLMHNFMTEEDVPLAELLNDLAESGKSPEDIAASLTAYQRDNLTGRDEQ